MRVFAGDKKVKKRVESVQISREACFRWLEEGDASGLSMAVSVAAVAATEMEQALTQAMVQ